MDKRGGMNIAMDSIIYLVICALVFIGMLWFVNSYSNAAGFWEDFYAKEIAGIINNAERGMEYKIDITNVAVIALKNGKPVKDIISIDNVNNQVIVSTRASTGTGFSFFNDVDIVEWKVEAPSGSPETTQFIFKVKEKQRDEVEL